MEESMPRNERLRQHRIQRNWRQQDVADQLGISTITIQRWERGTQHPSAYYRIKLCTLFGTSAQELGVAEETSSSVFSESEASQAEQSGLSPSEADKRALWLVPYGRNPHFTGRDGLLEYLTEHLLPEEPARPIAIRQAALMQTQAIKGLGGIGKTQTAVEYAYRAHEQGRYTHTLWINAASEEGILTSFVALADQLPGLRSLPRTDQQKLVVAAIRWLEQCEQPWLLIADNADDLDMVQPYLPRQGNGCILFTTRANAVGFCASSVEVDPMGLIEGTHLLLRRARRFAGASDEEIDEASNIAVELGQFPLALDQAGAYIEETGCSLRDYREIYQRHRHALLARRGRQTTAYPDSIATTWSLSFQHVEQANPAAADLLRLCAFLSPDQIPEELLIEGARYWPPALQQAAADRFAFNQMISDLLMFSLVKRLAEDRLLSIHRLVQVVQIERMGLQEQRQWAERLICAVNAVFPRDPKDNEEAWPFCLRYLEQAQACDALIQQHRLLLPEAADLLDRTAVYLTERALYGLAEPLYQRALWIWEQQSEAKPLQVARLMGNLASLYRNWGKYTEAEELYQRALRFLREQESSDDLLMANLLQGLANIHYVQAQYVEAEELYQQVLDILKRQGSSVDLLMGNSLHGLANVYNSQGKYVEAEELYQRVLRIMEFHLGVDKIRLMMVLSGLGHVYVQQEEYAEAEAAYQRALDVVERNKESDHPDATYPLIGIAFVYTRQGKYMEAEPFYLRALRIREAYLGPDHLQVSYPVYELANLYAQQGRYEEAESLYWRAVSIREQALGPDNPLHSDPLRGLANLYLRQGKYAEAEPIYQRALRIREQTLGPDSPGTAQVLHDFANFQQAQGKRKDAYLLYQRALTIRENVLGPSHPLTVATRAGLSTALSVSGQTGE
jgi:tetratricopeptide (TPR) repeat protein/transcriptional regulator with XRE-family HTH domain